MVLPDTDLTSQKHIYLECPEKGDGYCDGGHNIPECEYDGGDCCLEITDCQYCFDLGCVCHATGEESCFSHGNTNTSNLFF